MKIAIDEQSFMRKVFSKLTFPMNRSKTNLILIIVLVQIVAILAVYLPHLGFYVGTVSLLPVMFLVAVPVTLLANLGVADEYISIFLFVLIIGLLVNLFKGGKYLICFLRKKNFSSRA